MIFSSVCLGQQSDLDYLIKKVKADYPAYAEKSRNFDFDLFVNKVLAKNGLDTFKTMSMIVDFFRDGHLLLFRTKDSLDTFKCTQNLKAVKTYLNSNRRKKKYEGYWINESKHVVIGIKQISDNPIKLKGYVIECRDSNVIIPGFEYYDFEKEGNRRYFTKASSSLSRNTFYVHSDFRNDSVMIAGPYNKWKRMSDYKSPILQSLEGKIDTTTGKWLDSATYLITIPSSTIRNGKLLDSIIKSNPAITSKLNNLIVDIRNNTGGTVRAYSALLPLMYTNPILPVTVSAYCTDDVVQNTRKQIQEYVKQSDFDSAGLNQWTNWLSQQEANIGKFIDFPPDTLVLDSVLRYPKNIGLIVNYGCQSAAEMAILNAKQSKKITLFGEHTQGTIDYLDIAPQYLPSGKYQLYIPASKRQIPKGGKKLDGIGIYPDVSISDSEVDWVEFVKQYYEKH
jgi:hypothetical protein